MTKELDWLERQPKRRCLGPLNEDLDAVLAKMEHQADRAEARAERAEEKAQAAKLMSVAGRQRAAIEAARATGAERTGKAIGLVVKSGSQGLASLLKKMAHAGCGADLNPTLFAEVPETGVSTPFACPKCGMEHHATRIPAAPAEAEA